MHQAPAFAPRLPLDISSAEFIRHKVETYHWMLEERPVCPVTFSMLRGHFLSRYEDCEMVLRDARFRRQRGDSGGSSWAWLMPRSWRISLDTILNKDAPDHKRLRGFVQAAFTPRAVNSLEADVRARTHRLIDDMEAKEGPVDVIEALATPLPAMVIGELLGVDDQHMETFVELVRAVVSSFHGWGLVRNLTWDVPQLVRFLDRLIEHKRANPGKGLLSELIRIEQDGDRMTHDELAGIALALIIGGFETTTHLISTGLVALCEHPQAFASVREDPSLVPQALEEVMRFASPVYSTDRVYPTAPITLHGVTLSPGDMVLACVGAANRDPRAFEHPDVFDIHRARTRHLGFGLGAHYCIGAPLARLEARVVFESLLERFPTIELARPPSELTFVPTASLNAYAALPLKLSET